MQVPTGSRQSKNAAQSPGSFSRPEFLEKGAEPQTVEQCASHVVAATLVREFGVPHDARENAGFDVSSACDGADVASGAPLRVLGASATPSRCVPKCGQQDSDQTADVDGELPLLHRLKAVSSSVFETGRLHAVLEVQFHLVEGLLSLLQAFLGILIVTLLGVVIDVSPGCRAGGLRLRRQAHSRLVDFSRTLCRHLC